jgi:hypothetical protein
LVDDLGGAVGHGFGLMNEPVAGVVDFGGSGVADVAVAFLAADDFSVGSVGEFAEDALFGVGDGFAEFDEELSGGEPVGFLVEDGDDGGEESVEGRGVGQATAVEEEFGLEGGGHGHFLTTEARRRGVRNWAGELIIEDWSFIF